MTSPAAEPPAPSEILKALSHPLRRRILRAMDEIAPTSPVELAKALGAPLGGVAYHTRILDRHGVLDLVDVRQVRGAREHFYRATPRPRWAYTVLEECRQEDEPSSASK